MAAHLAPRPQLARLRRREAHELPGRRPPGPAVIITSDDEITTTPPHDHRAAPHRDHPDLLSQRPV